MISFFLNNEDVKNKPCEGSPWCFRSKKKRPSKSTKINQ